TAGPRPGRSWSAPTPRRPSPSGGPPPGRRPAPTTSSRSPSPPATTSASPPPTSITRSAGASPRPAAGGRPAGAARRPTARGPPSAGAAGRGAALAGREAEARAVEDRLQPLARDLEPDPNFGTLARPVRQAAEVEAEAGRAQLDQARHAPDSPRRLAELRQA